MPVIVSQDDAVYTNSVTITDAPAVRITGDRVRFVNSESGRVITSNATIAALSIEGEAATIINEAGGVMRAGNNSFDALIIAGSDGADRVENAGVIRGRVALGGGDDVFVSRVLTNDFATRVELGTGDDSFYLRPASGISLVHHVDGGDGVDRFIIFEAEGNVDGPLVHNVEILELRVNGFVESFSDLQTVLVDFREADRIFNALRFFNTPDAAVSILADSGFTNLSIYDRSSIGSLTGSAFSDSVAIGNDTLVSGAIDLGAGIDILTFFRSQFEAERQESFGTLLDGGADNDVLDLQLRGGDVFDAANVQNFEALWVSAPSDLPSSSALTLRNLNTVAEVILRQFSASPVLIEESDLSAGRLEVQPGVSVTIGAGSIVGLVESFVPFPLDTPVADDTQSISIRNDGQILGDVRMYIGDDLFDGRLGTVGGRVYGYAGNDRIETGAGDDWLDGGAGADFLSAGIGSDVLHGGSATDTLIGGAGNDVMYGGTGNDTYFVEDAGDQVVENGGEGNDRVAASVSYALAAGSEVETLEAITQSATTALSFTGNEFSNTIIGNNGINFLSGGGGSDTLIGLGGNDTLLGGAGNDAMYGGTGNDTYFVEDAGDQVIENGGEGNDRVAASVNYTLLAGSEVETLEAITQSATTALSFTGNEFSNTIIANEGANLISGGGGNDTLISLGGNDTLLGGAGNDAMYGGTGNDTYFVEDAGDQVIENGGEGNDRVAASVSYALLAGSEVETLEAITQSATNAMDLAGNAFSNTIIGNNGANVLNGGGGNDLMIGLGGNDVFIGSASAGTMYGGAGNDTYYVIDSADAVIENAGEGADRIAASTSYTLLAGSEVETLEAITQSATTALNFTGNALANTLIGNNGANVLDGKGGNDVLVGLGGADTFAFTTALGAGNVDIVGGFVSGSDRIALDDAVFAGLAPGALNPNAFVTGAAAADADDRIIYNSATGQLFYDADGNGSGAAVLFATLDGNPILAASDFTVI